jgi:FkbM family methyltransferase
MISLKIKKSLEKMGLYGYIRNIYRNFIIYIGRNGLKLKLRGTSVKIIISTPLEVNIRRSLYNERWLIEKFLSKIDNQTVIYDIGAHIGLYSLFAAKYKIAPKFIYCWEPEPHIFNRLKENINLNQIKTILPFSTALGSENGVVEMSTESEEFGISVPSFAIKSSTSIPVRVVRGDDWVLEKKLFPPSIIKIDVEGYEFNVIRGLRETIKKSKPIIFLEVHPFLIKNLGFTGEQILDFLKEMGYKINFFSYRGKEEHYILDASK